MDRNSPLSKRNSFKLPVKWLCEDWQALRRKLDNLKAGDTASGGRVKQIQIEQALNPRFSPQVVFAPPTCRRSSLNQRPVCHHINLRGGIKNETPGEF